jgi:hypothetical protein
MFKLPEPVLTSLRDGNPSALTPDEAKEAARYIDTLEYLPVLLKTLRDELRLHRRDQRARS